MWNATAQEITQLHQYVDKMRSLGASDKQIGDQLFEDGWQVKEIRQVMPVEIRHRNRLHRLFVGLTIVTWVLFIGYLPFLAFGGSLFMQCVLLGLMGGGVYFVYQAWAQFGHGSYEKVEIRRIFLCLERLRKEYGITPWSDDAETYRQLQARNAQKLFLPTIDSDYHKRLFVGHGTVGQRPFWVFVAKKLSYFVENSPVFQYFIFYELGIRPTPFYFSLVSEKYRNTSFQRHANRLQHSPLGGTDFKDMQFPGNEFNRAWKLRGTDQRLAYQIFDPHALQLLLGINQTSMVGIEISDSSVILSKRFDRNSIGEAVADVEHLRKFCQQAERNYHSSY